MHSTLLHGVLIVDRRSFLHNTAFLLGAVGLPALAATTSPTSPTRVAGGWRMADRDFQVGVVEVDWAAQQVRVAAAATVASLPHAVVPQADGSFLAVATRPGTWMVRVDTQGQVSHRLDMADEGNRRTLDGHVIASLDGQWLYTGETDRQSGDGWVSVRDARNLRKVAEHRTHGLDPHQILVDDQGALVIANGGIPRTPAGDKRNLEQMNPVLVRLDPTTGEKLGEWSLQDKRLAPHHIAWNHAQGGHRLLGIGLQAEHDDPAQRRDAPLLAVWDGHKLFVPSITVAEGYAGDVAAGPNGGFVLSAQRANRILLWQPQQPGQLTTIGKVQNPCGLWPMADAPGVAIGGGLGLARWHATDGAAMLRWPSGLSAGNHWAILA